MAAYTVLHMPPTYKVGDKDLPSGSLRPDWEQRLPQNMPARSVKDWTATDYPPNLVRHTMFYLQNGLFIDPASADGFNHKCVEEIEKNLKSLGYLPKEYKASGSFDKQSLAALTQFTRDQAPGQTVHGVNGNAAFRGGAPEARLADARNWQKFIQPVESGMSRGDVKPGTFTAQSLYLQYMDMHYGWGNVSAIDGVFGPETARARDGKVHTNTFADDFYKSKTTGKADPFSMLAAASDKAVSADKRRVQAEEQAQATRDAARLRQQQEAFSRGDWGEVRRLRDVELKREGVDPRQYDAKLTRQVADFQTATRAAAKDSWRIFTPGVNVYEMMRDPGIQNAVRDTAAFSGAAAASVAETGWRGAVTLFDPTAKFEGSVFFNKDGRQSHFDAYQDGIKKGWNQHVRGLFDVEGGDFRLASGYTIDNTKISIDGHLSDDRALVLDPKVYKDPLFIYEGNNVRVITNTGPQLNEKGMLVEPEWNRYGGSYIIGTAAIGAAGLFTGGSEAAGLKATVQAFKDGHYFSAAGHIAGTFASASAASDGAGGVATMSAALGHIIVKPDTANAFISMLEKPDAMTAESTRKLVNNFFKDYNINDDSHQLYIPFVQKGDTSLAMERLRQVSSGRAYSSDPAFQPQIRDYPGSAFHPLDPESTISDSITKIEDMDKKVADDPRFQRNFYELATKYYSGHEALSDKEVVAMRVYLNVLKPNAVADINNGKISFDLNFKPTAADRQATFEALDKAMSKDMETDVTPTHAQSLAFATQNLNQQNQVLQQQQQEVQQRAAEQAAMAPALVPF